MELKDGPIDLLVTELGFFRVCRFCSIIYIFLVKLISINIKVLYLCSGT